MRGFQRFYQELSRRNVYKVAAAYAAVAFIVIQVADLVFPAFSIGLYGYRLVVIISLLGFPVALVLAWIFEITPDGVRVTSDADDQSPPKRRRMFVEAALSLIVLLSVLGASWYLAGVNGSPEPPPLENRTIAVLPFDAAQSPESETFADGIHEDLVTRLANIRGLQVIARNSTIAYRNTTVPLSQISSELNAGWLVTGSVQSSGNQAKISVRLVDPATSVQPWAESYVYEITAANLFATQSEITHKVADALRAHLTPDEEAQVQAMPTDNLAAFQMYVEASTLLRQRQEPQMRRALDLFLRATTEDPGYALAWAGLADTYIGLVDYGFDMPAGSIARGTSAAQRAIELEAASADGYVSLANAKQLELDGRAALRALETALKLGPTAGEAFSKISWTAQILGRLDMAYQAAESAVELDPLSVEAYVNRALTLMIDGDGEAALETLQDQSSYVQPWPTTKFYEGVVLYHLGRFEESAAVLNGLSISWAGAGPLSTEALALIGAGEETAARNILTRLRESDAHPFLVGLVLAGLGDTDAALSEFDGIKNWDVNSDWAIIAARYLFPSVLEEARADARFDRLLRNIDRTWGLVL